MKTVLLVVLVFFSGCTTAPEYELVGVLQPGMVLRCNAPIPCPVYAPKGFMEEAMKQTQPQKAPEEPPEPKRNDI